MIGKRQLWLFFGAVVCVAAAMGVHESIFNNFLSDTFDIKANVRGALEFPRELPGLLVVLMAGMLALLPVTRLGATGGVVLMTGLVGMALLGNRWYPMLALMVVTSAGMHLLMPVSSSIAISLSDEGNKGRRLGWLGTVRTLGAIVGSGGVWLLFDRTSPQYRTAFLVAALIAGGGAALYGLMHVPHLHQPRSRLVFRRRYGLYYSLELLFGARKQIFLTFGPWVLIQVYGEPASHIAMLLVIASGIGVFFKPLVGIVIDRFGERAVLVADGLVLSLVCLGYGYAGHITDDASDALNLARVCFVLDNLLFALGTGRSVYVSRMTPSAQELTSTLTMGVSVNHLASMIIPFFAGMLWVSAGFQNVFLASAVLAIFISGVSSLVPGKKHRHALRIDA